MSGLIERVTPQELTVPGPTRSAQFLCRFPIGGSASGGGATRKLRPTRSRHKGARLLGKFQSWAESSTRSCSASMLQTRAPHHLLGASWEAGSREEGGRREAGGGRRRRDAVHTRLPVSRVRAAGSAAAAAAIPAAAITATAVAT